MWVLSSSCDRGKQSQLLLQPTEDELGLQVGVEFDNCIFVNVIESESMIRCNIDDILFVSLWADF